MKIFLLSFILLTILILNTYFKFNEMIIRRIQKKKDFHDPLDQSSVSL